MMVKSYLLHLFHPKDSWVLMKRRGRKNWAAALILLLAAVAVRLLSVLVGSYLFGGDKENVNILLEVAKILVPTLSLAVSCYAITSIMSGEVKFRELLTAFCYALLPFVLLTLPITLIGWVFTLNETTFYNLLNLLMWAWVFLLGFGAVKQLNDYELSKTVLVLILSLLAMLLLWITLVLVAIFCIQWVQFFEGIFEELRLLTLR